MAPEAMEGLDIDELRDALLMAKKRVRYLGRFDSDPAAVCARLGNVLSERAA